MLVICIYKTISESIKYIDGDTIPVSKNLSFSVKCLKMYPALCEKHFNRFSGFYNMYKWKLYTYLQWNIKYWVDFPGGASGKEPAYQCRRHKRCDPLEERMPTHCSSLAWRIPWKEEPGGLQFIGLQSQTRLKWLGIHARSTPVCLPGESHGQRSLVSYSPWSRKELDTTEWLNNNNNVSILGTTHYAKCWIYIKVGKILALCMLLTWSKWCIFIHLFILQIIIECLLWGKDHDRLFGGHDFLMVPIFKDPKI